MVVSDFWSWTNANNKTEVQVPAMRQHSQGGAGRNGGHERLVQQPYSSFLHMMQAVQVLRSAPQALAATVGGIAMRMAPAALLASVRQRLANAISMAFMWVYCGSSFFDIVSNVG